MVWLYPEKYDSKCTTFNTQMKSLGWASIGRLSRKANYIKPMTLSLFASGFLIRSNATLKLWGKCVLFVFVLHRKLLQGEML